MENKLSILEVIHGDALTSLAQLEGESVQTCVTSPPYWGLRSYGTEPVVWDNHNGCEHEWSVERTSRPNSSGGPTEKQLSNAGTRNIADYSDRATYSNFCECGAWRGELGLEPTPELYVKHIVDIFREVRRVLRNDGTCWINLGDSYASGKGSCFNPGGGEASLEGHATLKDAGAYKLDRGNKSDLAKIGLKPKDLVGVPWMVAFALRADGWYLRSDIIWSKPNPMPESVTDRPTKSHEYIFLLSKSQRYFFDQDAVKEKVQDCSIERAKYSFDASRQRMNQSRIGGADYMLAEQLVPADGMRNIRSVWNVSTQPFSGAHFATFPPDLITPCILAGTSARGRCPACGAPWRRLIEKGEPILKAWSAKGAGQYNDKEGVMKRTTLAEGSTLKHTVPITTLGWIPTCRCPEDDSIETVEPIPCVVLDPFAGSGTTGKVAIELGRKAVLIEPKREYIEMIKKRCQTTMGFQFA